jgi:membrane-associated protein
MELWHTLSDLFLHLDKNLPQWADRLGPWFHVLLFAIVFCETGLIVTPFLPGDSLLFAVGALTALSGEQVAPISLVGALVLLAVAAVLGDALNYAVGRRFGERLARRGDTWYFKRAHLERTQRFYELHGGKTIVIARFMPIVRTFAPFVAGMGRMRYTRFASFNVAGGVLWVACFVLAGYWFGNLPWVQHNFHYVIVAIIVLSCLPGVIQFLRSRRTAT